jgi:hypothetical protein
MSTPNIPWDQPLNHTNYPNVRFWFRRDWINRKKETSGITNINQSNTIKQNKGRAPSGLNVTLRYVEDANGVVVDGFRASEMRKFARAIWNQLQAAGKAPKSWGKADLDVATHYRCEMRRRFPEFGLCEFDWKAEQLATDNYPNWASNNIQGVKLESSDSLLTHSKRRRDSVDQVSKRAKTGSISPSPIDVDSTPSSNVISTTANLSPVDPGSTITPANLPPSSITQPAMLPNIVVTAHTVAPNIKEPACPNISNISVNITSDHLNGLPVNSVPTDSMLTFVNQELGEDDVPTGPTAASTVLDSISAIAVASQVLPIPVATDALPSFDIVNNNRAAAAAETANSSLAASLPGDCASVSGMSMPRVRMF